MTQNDGYWKFTKSISKFVHSRGAKARKSDTVLNSSTKHLDELLEEEYETLLREIDYLTSEKSCYLSFKNDQFSKGKSSQDLVKILDKHSEDVLKTYIEMHDKCPRETAIKTQADLVNYVTKIVVSKPKCNHKRCTCKPVTVSKEVLTEPRLSKDSGQATQTTYSSHKATETRPQRPRILIKKENKPAQVTTQVQTESWSHDPNCTCGCCPKKTGPQITSRSMSTDAKTLQNRTTSDRRATASKYILANCVGETIETQTVEKLCVPENFETLLTSDARVQFSTCSGKQDCGCEDYDPKEALKIGLLLPGGKICVQSKKVQAGNENPYKKKKPFESSTSLSIASSTSDGRAKEEIKSKSKKTGKQAKTMKKVPSEEFASSASSGRRNIEKDKKNTTGCFGSKKKRKLCDEYCQGMAGRQQSVQTLPIRTKDKNEHIQFSDEKTSTSTSTDSEAGIQVSARPSREDSELKGKQDKGVSLREEKEVGHDFEGPTKSQKSRDKNENTCNKCGRQKRNCDNACRNTIIIPYATGSNGGIPPGEAESLRMLIKMQSRDTSRQFDGILAELNHHKGEIKRLNSMYQKMVNSSHDSQKSGRKSKKSSDISHECGCSYKNECRTEQTTKVADQSYEQCMCKNSSGASNNEPSRRFGPPNTAVAINMCDTCTVKISPNNIAACGSRDHDYFDGDKHRKNEFNRSKRASSQDILPTRDFREGGDLYSPSNQDSISTIYNKSNKQDSNMRKKEGHINLLIDQEEEDEEYEEDEPLAMPRLKTKSDDDVKRPKRLHSSRVLIWLKKSWITIRHKTEECRKEKAKSNKGHQVLNFCQSSAKKVAVNVWKSLKPMMSTNDPQ